MDIVRRKLPLVTIGTLSIEDDIKRIPYETTRDNKFFDDRFATIASKLEKVGPNFSILNPCSSLPSVSKEDK